MHISVQNPVIEAVADVPRASNSTSTVTSGNGELVVKFARYDKSQPDNPQTLVGRLLEVLNGNSDGFYQVTLTVEAELSTTGETFRGTDEIRVKLGTDLRRGAHNTIPIKLKRAGIRDGPALLKL